MQVSQKIVTTHATWLVFNIQRVQARRLSTEDLQRSDWGHYYRKSESIHAVFSSHTPGSTLLPVPRWLLHMQKSRLFHILLAQLCFTRHLHKPSPDSNSVQEVPVAVKELSAPLHYFAAEVTRLLCLQLLQLLITWQCTTASSSGALRITGVLL